MFYIQVKKILLSCLVAMLLFGCGINNQTRQVKALQECVYQISSADSVFIAGKEVSDKNLSLDKMPGLALAYLRQDIPFKARLNLQIKNPGHKLAGVNQFEYKVLIKEQEIANGYVNQKVSIAPGATLTVPVSIQGNLYPILSNGSTLKDIGDILAGIPASDKEKRYITFKIKPTISFWNKQINYPGYITINKEVKGFLF
ncbi:MAG TPA: hypothetical protein VEV16_08970 [Daejeonella sp.]|nr:hypothetical protein [Daejeonella sp.]